MARKKSPPSKQPSPLDAQTFVREFATRQKQMLKAMHAKIRAGEIALDDSPLADRYIENVISEWCQHEEPVVDLHMMLIGAVYLWALLDVAYDGAVANDNEYEGVASGVTGADIAMEVLKTIQKIWGRQHGKA